MKYLIAADNAQLHRIEAAIIAFNGLSASQRLQRRSLFDALMREKNQLLNDRRNGGRSRLMKRAA